MEKALIKEHFLSSVFGFSLPLIARVMGAMAKQEIMTEEAIS